jgi:hypothetical protein
MKQVSDDKTIDFIGVKGTPGRKKIYASASEKQAAYRARHGKTSFTINLPTDLIDELRQFLDFKDLTRDECIEKLIRTQLLRKR